MKYLTVGPIKAALERIHNGGNTQEHRTSTATLGLINNYFPKEKFITTPEQIQIVSNKRPDYTIERLNDNKELVIHAFSEVKSLINSNFDNILDQLGESIQYIVDFTGGDFSVYAIAMKGTKIAIYVYYNLENILEENGITHYKGFVPLNYEIPYPDYEDMNYYKPTSELQKLTDYVGHLKRNIETNPTKLQAMGVKSTPKLNHPHIWDLLNKDHEDHIHNMFMHIASSDPGKDIKI